MENQERIRLLLIDGSKENRSSNIANGVGNVFGRWPSYIASAVWCVICVISLIILIIVLTIAIVINERFIQFHDLKVSKESISSQIVANEFCKRATDRENHIAGRSVKSLLNPETIIQDTSENLFYSLVEPLNWKQACSVESVLRLCPDKIIYLMHFANNKTKNSRYEKILRRRYSNLNEMQANGPNYVKASPFEGWWRADNASLLATNLLTVWQFGGTTLSPNLIMMSRKMLDSDSPNCLVDREVIFCPEQCSPYIYELIYTLNKDINNNKGGKTEDVIDSSIAEFCGGSEYSRRGCAGVTRIDESLMCTTKTTHCMFIRTEEWSRHDKHWKKYAEQYCPEIIKTNV